MSNRMPFQSEDDSSSKRKAMYESEPYSNIASHNTNFSCYLSNQVIIEQVTSFNTPTKAASSCSVYVNYVPYT